MNLLGIDYGHKRIGLAYADSDLGVAVPIEAAVEASYEERLAHISREIKLRRIHKIVVGYPFNMDGSMSDKAKEVDAFIADISGKFNLPVERCDERLSSFQAEQDLMALNPRIKLQSMAARKKRRRSGDIDSRAIALVLQDYLDSGMRPQKAGEDTGAF